MSPRSPAARLLAEHGVSAADIAKRTGYTRQCVSWHLSGGSAAWPNWLWDTLEETLGPSVTSAIADLADDSRKERRHG